MANPWPIEMRLAAAGNDLEASRAVAERLGGSLYADHREAWQHLPLRALVTAVTDDIEALRAVADVGLYVVAARTVKAGDCAAVGLFPMVHKPGLTRAQADAHWRDNHAPLALEHHQAMTHYTQLAVMHTIAGREFGGFALCGFANEADLRERFFSLPDSVEVINADVAKFADTRRSPRRLVAVPEHFG